MLNVRKTHGYLQLRTKKKNMSKLKYTLGSTHLILPSRVRLHYLKFFTSLTNQFFTINMKHLKIC